MWTRLVLGIDRLWDLDIFKYFHIVEACSQVGSLLPIIKFSDKGLVHLFWHIFPWFSIPKVKKASVRNRDPVAIEISLGLRVLNFYANFGAIMECCHVDLTDWCCGKRFFIKCFVYLMNRLTEFAFNNLFHLVKISWRHLVFQDSQLSRKIIR